MDQQKKECENINPLQCKTKEGMNNEDNSSKCSNTTSKVDGKDQSGQGTSDVEKDVSMLFKCLRIFIIYR